MSDLIGHPPGKLITLGLVWHVYSYIESLPKTKKNLATTHSLRVCLSFSILCSDNVITFLRRREKKGGGGNNMYIVQKKCRDFIARSKLQRILDEMSFN